MRRLLVSVFITLAAACSPSSSQSSGGNVTVYAASSLTHVFEQMAAELTGINVEFNFAGTPTLLHQLEEGAKAEVFASADETNMQKAVDAGLVASPSYFAENLLQIVVPPDNPADVTGIADLARPGVKVALAAPAVPAGRYARESLAKAGIDITPVTEEDNVKAIVAKVAAGEVDAGVVYITDAFAAGTAVKRVAIAPEHNVVARYPIAILRSAGNPAGAQRFVDLVLSPRGQALLRQSGFTIA